MKRFFPALLSFAFITLCACDGGGNQTTTQPDTETVDSVNQVKLDSAISPTAKQAAPEDTVILHRAGNEYGEWMVFIDPDHNSQNYQWALDFRLDEYDSSSILASYEHAIADNPEAFAYHLPFDFPEHWLKVVRHQGTYYLYLHYGYSGLRRFTLSDSAIVHYYMDGPYPRALHAATQVGSRHHQFIYEGNGGVQETLTTYQLDEDLGLVVMADGGEKNVYIPRDQAGKLDLIVNYGSGEVSPDYEFDDIDYDTLLKDFL